MSAQADSRSRLLVKVGELPGELVIRALRYQNIPRDGL